MDQIKSRKLIATVVAGLVVVANAKFALGLDQASINALVLLIGAYVASQAFVDAQQQ